MLIPAPLPDEIAEGYCGRIRILNGLDQLNQVFGRMAYFVNSPLTKNNLQLLAQASGIPYSRFIRSHTLVPFAFLYGGTAGRTKKLCGTPFEALPFRWVKKSHLYYCPECKREDIDFHGVSYWRRAHQVPGINWCMKHGLPLIQKLDIGDAMTTPATEGIEVRRFTKHYVMKSRANYYVRRYEQICCDYLDQERVLDTLQFSRRLRGKKVGFRDKYMFLTLHLTRLANERMPIEWLRVNFPQVAANKNAWVWSLDGIISASHCRFATENYVLAASLVLPDEPPIPSSSSTLFRTESHTAIYN